MIQQIRVLEGLNDGQELPSIKLELMRKKTILIHTLHRQAKLYRKKRQVRDSDIPDKEMEKLI